MPKEMQSGKKIKAEESDTTYKEFDDIQEECDFIAKRIKELHSVGVKYSEMAILLRKHKFGASFAETFQNHYIPFIIEGVNELFNTPECNAAKGIFDYLNGELDMTGLFKLWTNIDYELDEKEVADAIGMLSQMNVKDKKFYGDFCLQQVYHDFLRKISIANDPDNASAEIILYNLGKFSQVIDDLKLYIMQHFPKINWQTFVIF